MARIPGDDTLVEEKEDIDAKVAEGCNVAGEVKVAKLPGDTIQ